MVPRWLIACLLALSAAGPSWAAAAEDPVAIATLHRRQHRFQAAEEALVSVLERSPEHLGANLQMAYLKHYLGDDQACLPYMKRAAASHPGDLEAQVMLVHAYIWADRIDDAERQAEKTAAAWEGRAPDRSLWAKLLVGLGGVQGLRAKRDGLWAMVKYGLAVRGTFEKAYAADPEGSMPLYALGRYYLEAPAVAGGDPRKGLDLLRRAIRREPDDHGARADYLRYLVQLDRRAEAREELAAYQKAFDDVPAAMAAVQPLASRLK